MSLVLRLRAFFTSNFNSESFAYVLYPFIRIFKFFGFAPVKLKNGEIFKRKVIKIKHEFSIGAWLWSILVFLLYIAGFILAVEHLSKTENLIKLRDNAIIAFYTNWIQIVALFAMGAMAVLSSWLHLDDMRCLIKTIFKIDRELNLLEGIKIDYESLRHRLFTEFIIAFIVPVSLSMVNCIVIQPIPEQFVLSTSCFWFICFAPIMLLTFKEFQFYNLMFILKLKFEYINGKLRVFGNEFQNYHRKFHLSHRRVGTLDSISQIPLTTMTTEESSPENNNANDENVMCVEKPSIETLQKLLKIYSKVADSVELLLKIFSWHLVMLTAVSVGVIIIQCYNLFALLVNSLQMHTYQVFFVIAWILVQLTVVGVNVAVCSMTSKTMSQTGPLLHKIQPIMGSSDSDCVFYQVVQVFSLEVLQRTQVFSAAGYFDMNYKLLTSIITSVTTYLVIIIQFHFNNVTILTPVLKEESE